MGCTQSKFENEEAVLRCKERKQFMKEAVSARNAFAAAHSFYVVALKNTGAALSDYAQGEVRNPNSIQLNPSQANNPEIASHLAYEALPKPPPPLPPDMPPLSRAASLPVNLPKGESKPVVSTIEEEDEEEDELENAGGSSLKHRSSKGRGGGSVGNTSSRANGVKEDVRNEDNVNNKPVSPISMVGNNVPEYYEYFFPPADNVPVPTLNEVVEEEVKIDRKQVESSGFDERPKRVEKKVEVVVEPEKVFEPPPGPVRPVMVAGEGGGGGESGGTAGGRIVKNKKGGGKANVNMVQIFGELDEHFLKAYESAHEVSKMLEATRLHYHSNFADNRGHIDHSKRVMRVITWNRSFRGLPNNDDDGKDDDDSEEHETHATVLDKLLAWEKKLYDEVKAGELLKFEYQRKVAMLSKQKKRSSNSDSLEKTKAAVSHLHTRYIVDMQSMDSTVLEINRLRDQQLYAKLVQLVDAMAQMWKTMKFHHDSQFKRVLDLRFLDINQSTEETTEHHHECTFQLFNVARDWHSQFGRLVGHQKEYIKALNSWLRLNVIPIESSIKEKVSSPPRNENPPIRALVQAWQDKMDNLPDEEAKSAIFNFQAVLETIVHSQDEELKMKVRCAETRKELDKKNRQFKDWCDKYEQRRTPKEDTDPGEDQRYITAVTDRQVVIDMLTTRLEEDEASYNRLRIQVREKTLANFRNRMPELFKAMVLFADACERMYSDLSRSLDHENVH